LTLENLDAWEACTAASEQCPDLVEIAIGEGGGGMIPPGPGRPVPFDKSAF
jgi:hypothetical protein